MRALSPEPIFKLALVALLGTHDSGARANGAAAPPTGKNAAKRPHPSPWARSGLSLALLVVIFVSAIPTSAAVLDTRLKWSTDPATGLTEIPVCIADGSSTSVPEKPSVSAVNLATVVKVVRHALKTTWESRSSIQFTGWGSCSDLSSAEREKSVGLFIHPDAENNSLLGTAAKGVKHRSENTSFRPWGRVQDCIRSHLIVFETVYSYTLDCAQQYAIHEFGHVIGLLHEWQHPKAPAACTRLGDGNEPKVKIGSSTLPLVSSGSPYIIPNRTFDKDSIMTYRRGGGGVCADVTGVRFGSREPNSHDYQAVALAYPPPVPRITSPLEVRAASGEPLRYRIEATASPTSYDARFSGIKGLTVNSSTGVISGTPLAGIGGSLFITAANEHGESAPATLRVVVGRDRGVEVRDGLLFVYGKNDRQKGDRIVIEPSGRSRFNVSINDEVFPVEASPFGITVYGQDGDDDIRISDSMPWGVAIYGGPGNDTLKGGSALDCLFGGHGQDSFVRSSANCVAPQFLHFACRFDHLCNLQDFTDATGSETWQAPPP